MQFSDLPLDSNILKGVEALGFTSPTPVQEESIPLLIQENRDLIGLAQTGTGKTAAFGLPMIHKIDVNKKIVQGLDQKLQFFLFLFGQVLLSLYFLG